jgi:hypothetical protein
MGLDMYLFEIKKPSLLLSNYDFNDPKLLNCLKFDSEDIENEEIKELLPYTIKVDLTQDCYDKVKIKKDYNLNGSALRVSRICNDGCVFATERGETTPPIPEETLKEKYIKQVVSPFYICEYNELHYWRKAYVVQDFIHASSKKLILNCGYYEIDKETLDGINSIDPNFNLDKFENCAHIFYHEWY